jgi:hydroxymethylpyrimidine pyrophosphatase-like HAD family hydrolase
VVGENGALAFAYDRERRKMTRWYCLSSREAEEGRTRLRHLKERILREVPGTAEAADQRFRLTDLAIDYCEDVPRLPEEAVRRICEIAEEEGASFKVSSIHVNCWYGSFDKVSSVKAFLDRETGKRWEELCDSVLFIGDSPNDEPLFRDFPASIGVANLTSFFDQMTFLRTCLTLNESARGFREAVDIILAKRIDEGRTGKLPV